MKIASLKSFKTKQTISYKIMQIQRKLTTTQQTNPRIKQTQFNKQPQNHKSKILTFKGGETPTAWKPWQEPAKAVVGTIRSSRLITGAEVSHTHPSKTPSTQSSPSSSPNRPFSSTPRADANSIADGQPENPSSGRRSWAGGRPS